MSDTKNDCVCRVPEATKWDGQEMSFNDQLFVKTRVRSFLRIPINYGAVMERVTKQMEAAGSLPVDFLSITDENSLWGSDVYVAASKTVPGANMDRITGRWLAKIFTGAYSDIPKWIEVMRGEFKTRGRELGKVMFYYATCPKCAKKFGKNYVVVLGLLS